MDLGVRQIRSAGQGSGSVEVTLPAELRDLVGLPCRVTLRDGVRPDIVLQPDLRRARNAFAALWAQLAAALLSGADHPPAPELPIGSFAFALRHNVRGRGEPAPALAWLDGHALAERPPHPMPAASRTLAAFAQELAPLLGIAASLAPDFGASAAFALTGVIPDPSREEACALASASLAGSAMASAALAGAAFTALGAGLAAARADAGEDMLDAGFWHEAAPMLQHLVDLFLGWTLHPAKHGALRAAWRRGVAIELNGG